MSILRLVKTASLNLGIIVVFTLVFIYCKHFNKGKSFKEKLKNSWNHVTEYKVNIILFAFFSSLPVLLPELDLPHVEIFSVNELAEIVVVSVGTVTTAQSQLPPINFNF